MPDALCAGSCKGGEPEMTGPGPSDPAGQEPVPPAVDPPPVTPPAQPAAGGNQWGQQGQTPEWAEKAQQWRPAEVASGPTTGIAYADLGIRIGAYIIDLVILVIVGIIVNLFLAAILIGALFATGGGGAVIVGLVILVVNVLLAGAYFVYTWTTMKASPGQRMLGLMTVSEADGSALSQNQAIMRYLVMFAPGYIGSLASNVVGGFIGLLLSLVGLGWTIYLIYTTANDPKRQGFHDKYVKSVVVKPAA
jgi:uncharacterized RDD family membrane protein YckC